MWDPMWIVASFQSTRDPFIQILPVPGKAICLLLSQDLIRRQDGRDGRERRGWAGTGWDGQILPLTAPLRRTGTLPSGPGAACGNASRIHAAVFHGHVAATESRPRSSPLVQIPPLADAASAPANP